MDDDDDDNGDDDDATDVAAAVVGAGPRAQPHPTTPQGGGEQYKTARAQPHHTTPRGGGGGRRGTVQNNRFEGLPTIGGGGGGRAEPGSYIDK